MWKPGRFHIALKLWSRRKPNSQTLANQKKITCIPHLFKVQLSSIQKIQLWLTSPCNILPFFASDSCCFGWQGIIFWVKIFTSVISDNYNRKERVKLFFLLYFYKIKSWSLFPLNILKQGCTFLSFLVKNNSCSTVSVTNFAFTSHQDFGQLILSVHEEKWILFIFSTLCNWITAFFTVQEQFVKKQFCTN